MRDIINAFSYMDSLIGDAGKHKARPQDYDPAAFKAYEPMDYFANEFYDRKDAMVIAEMQILKRLGFHTQCGLPYGHLANYCQVLGLASDNRFVAQCWGHLNDMFHTPIPALYPQSTMATACIYLVSRKAQVALPLEPTPWWQLFDCTETELHDIIELLLQLYRDWQGEPVWTRFAKLPRSKARVRELLDTAAQT